MEGRNTGQDSAPSTTLWEVVAIMVSYRRLIVVWGIVPLLVVTSPFLLGLSLLLLNSATAGHGFLSALLGIGLTHLGRRTIRLYAPSPKQRDNALAQSQVSLPLLSLLLGRAIIISILAPMGKRLGISGILAASPSIPYTLALRIAGSTMILGASVLFRFIGPISIVRCSSMPLKSHPMSSTIRSIWKRCSSIDSLLELIAGPGDSPGLLIKPLHLNWHDDGCRYQRPSNLSCGAQILLTTMFGVILAKTIPVRQQHKSDMLTIMMSIATCVMTMLSNLIFTTLDGNSHELDPKRYPPLRSQKTISIFPLPANLRTLFSSVVLVPVLSMGVVLLSEEENEMIASSMELLRSVLLCLLTSTLVTIYLILVDEAARRSLCEPGLNLNRILEELSDDISIETSLDVVLHSVLHGNHRLVQSILEPTQNAAILHVEEEEVRRNDQGMLQMANTLLGIDKHPAIQGESLEQDILRISLMESLGGKCDFDSATSFKMDQASDRHVEAVARWVHPQKSVWIDARPGEPVAVPLVRGLCAYAGGLGEALRICSLPPSARPLKYDASFASWSLPPGARACAEWAISAAARCLCLSFTSSNTNVPDWRSSHLAMLVPVTLHACYSLRCGVVNFVQSNQGRRTVSTRDNESDWITRDTTGLHRLALACDDTALLVLETLRSLEGSRKVDVQVHTDCRPWLSELLAKSC